MGVSNILALLGGVALFLFGMSLMGDSLKKVAGSKLEIILYKLSGTPLKGILLGTGVTAVIQSSCATSVMAVGFVNSGMMKLRQAIAVIMGSIIGTSITGWILCLSELGAGGVAGFFSTETLTSVVAVVGVVLYMFSKKNSRRHFGGILLGFAVLMFGMKTMSSSVAVLKSSPAFVAILSDLSHPLVAILIGIVITAILQSASAAVGILQALAITGAVSFDMAFALMMGISIGASVPVLMSAIGAQTDGKRSAWAYPVVACFGVVICSLVFYPLNAVQHFSFMSRTMTAVSIAFVNSLFRFINIILTAPFIRTVERICCAFVKEDPDQKAAREDIDRLEERFLSHPSLALEQSRLTIDSMAERTRTNLFDAMNLMDNYTDAGFSVVERDEGAIDRYEDKLGTYLVRINAHELDDQQNETGARFLHSVTDFERISDHALNVAEAAREVHEKKITFSVNGQRELQVLTAAIHRIVDLTVDAFLAESAEKARCIEPLEELIDDLCEEIKKNHANRVQNGQCTWEHGFVFNDLISNYERVADHCSNLAVALLEMNSGKAEAHAYLNEVKEKREESFRHYYEEYAKEFSL